jgi:hypothetical protein
MQFILYLAIQEHSDKTVVYHGRTTRCFTLAIIQDGLPCPDYDDVLSWPELYKAVYLGQNTIWFGWSTRRITLARIQYFTFAGVQGSLPWLDYNMHYLCSLPWPEHKTVYLGQTTICCTFAGIQGSLPWIEYKTVNLGQNHNMPYLCWNTRQFTLARIQDCLPRPE